MFNMDTQVTAAKLYTLKLCYLSTLLWRLYKMQTKPQAVYSNSSTLQVWLLAASFTESIDRADCALLHKHALHILPITSVTWWTETHDLHPGVCVQSCSYTADTDTSCPFGMVCCDATCAAHFMPPRPQIQVSQEHSWLIHVVIAQSFTQLIGARKCHDTSDSSHGRLYPCATTLQIRLFVIF